MAFGGQSWPINPEDFNAGQISSGSNALCLGAIFDLSLGSNNIPDSNSPTWVVGDTFLVRNLSRLVPLILHTSSFFFFSRKTFIRCSVRLPRLLGLPSCLLLLVGLVQQELARVLQALLLLVFLVCVSFFCGLFFFLFYSPPVSSALMLNTFSSFLMVSTVTTVIIMCV